MDKRLMRVIITVDGSSTQYDTVGDDGLAMKASITKSSDPKQNKGEVTIEGLRREERERVLMRISPWRKDKKMARLEIQAGRESWGLRTLFVGDITGASITQPPDIQLRMTATTGQNLRTTASPVSAPATHNLQQVAEDIAKRGGLNLHVSDKAPLTKTVTNWRSDSGCQQQIEELSRASGCDVSIDDSELVIKPRGQHKAGSTSVVISRDSGMVGIPELSESGLKVKCLLDPAFSVGCRYRVESELHPGATGWYVADSISWELATHDTAWYVALESKSDKAKEEGGKK